MFKNILQVVSVLLFVVGVCFLMVYKVIIPIYETSQENLDNSHKIEYPEGFPIEWQIVKQYLVYGKTIEAVGDSFYIQTGGKYSLYGGDKLTLEIRNDISRDTLYQIRRRVLPMNLKQKRSVEF